MEEEMKDSTAKIIVGLVALALVLAINAGYCAVKASRLNANYGTNYTWYDVMLGVDKQRRQIGVE